VTAVLVIDDEPQILRALRINLRVRQYEVHTAGSAGEALELAAKHPPDLVILDLGLPDLDGVEVIHGLRGWTEAPIIVLSGRADSTDKVEALDAGADDYVTKPFGMEELLARVRANLRRLSATGSDEPTVIEAGDFLIDQSAHKVTVRGREVHLTPKEFELLTYLARNANKVVTHRALLAAVWGGNATEQVEYLRVFVGQLRKKLESSSDAPRYILTEPWVGYRFEPGC
jgi:two-component system KDP operon response regulator KdpE